MKAILDGVKTLIKRNARLYNAARYFSGYLEAVRGADYARREQRAALQRGVSVSHGLAVIRSRWPDVVGAEEASPVFICAAGWRSGSTLLQRLIMSSEKVLIWGEPYSHSGLIDGLMEPLKAFTDAWPNDDWFISNDNFDDSRLEQLWVANLYPEVEYLNQAGCSYLEALLAKPASERGFPRWGLKEVRLTIEHARYLHWLYPNARFLFLYRNPYKAYMSYRSARDWYRKWPDQPVFTPRAFGEHWAELMGGFVEGCQDVGGLMVKYEDLIDGGTSLTELENYLQLAIDPAVLSHKVGGSSDKSKTAPAYELRRIRKTVDPLAVKLGYRYGESIG